MFSILAIILTIGMNLNSFTSNAEAVLPPLSSVTVEVPELFQDDDPFTVPRQLVVPVDFGVKVYARVPKARFILVLPNGDALVSQPDLGKVTLLHSSENGNDYAETFDYLAGLKRPHDMILVVINNTEYLYISESNGVSRYKYVRNALSPEKDQVIVSGLPDDPPFRHPLKNIAIKNSTLYVAIGSDTNDDPSSLERNPKCGAIYSYPLEGGEAELVSEGVRNAEGLAVDPQTGFLWAVVNGRDDVQYPYHDPPELFGQVIPEYVDENPPEEFVRIEKGYNYGWPFCNPVPSESMDNLSYVPDAARNPDGVFSDCKEFKIVEKGMEPHSAPLSLTFWTGDAVPSSFRNGALVGMHGSWNRLAFSGHKIAFFPWENNRPGKMYNLVAGWVTDPVKKERWGRPVDTGVLQDGSLLITDDFSGTVYRLYKK